MNDSGSKLAESTALVLALENLRKPRTLADTLSARKVMSEITGVISFQLI